MKEWRHDLRRAFPADTVATALWHALTGETVVIPGLAWATSAGTVTCVLAPGFELRETWEWRATRDDEVLHCTARTFEAPAFTLDWWPMGCGRVTIRVDEPALGVAVHALFGALGMSPDELDALDDLARSAAFSADSFDRPHARLDAIRYSPLRLAYVMSDKAVEIARLQRIARERPELDAAPLCEALLLAGTGQLQEALTRLDAALGVPRVENDIALARIDVLSRLGRHADAEAALAQLSASAPADPLAHSTLALAVAVHRRAGHPLQAAAAARKMASIHFGSQVLGVLDIHARLVEARCLDEAGDHEAARAIVGGMRGSLPSRIGRPAQWFLVEHLDMEWLRRVAG